MKKLIAMILSAFLLLGGAFADQEVILPDGLHSLMLSEGNGADLIENAQTLVSSGKDAEVREIGGVELLVYRDTDEADGAKCIGYMYPTGDSFVEICFWYGTNEAGLKIRSMMESFRELE